MWSVIAAVVGIVVGIGGIVATVVFYSMVRGQRDSVEFLTVANEGLRRALSDTSGQVSQLRGQIDILKSGIVEKVAVKVAEEVGARIATRLDALLQSSFERGNGNG